MKRREFLGAISGSFALSMASPYLGATAQERNTTRTIHETAAERLRQVYSYVPNTPEYEALAVDDVHWADLSKQFDAFGYLHRRKAFFDDVGIAGSVWLARGGAFQAQAESFVYVPTMTADQVLEIGASHVPPKLTLLTGIDPTIPAGIFQEKGYESMSFKGGSVYVHAEQDVVKKITWNRFAVLLNEGVLVWFDSAQQAHNYAAWIEAGKSSLADRQLVPRHLELVEPDAITLASVLGARLDMDGSARRVLGDYASEDTVEAFKDQVIVPIRRQEELFGKMPRVQSMTVSFDAGALYISDSEKPAPELVSGYGVPRAHVKLTFGSNDDAYLAGEIIEWRMKNAPSWINREIIDFEPLQPRPIDRSDVRNGVLTHRFDQPTAARHVQGMLLQSDLAIYGWGEFS